MSSKKKLGWLLLSGASLAAMGAFSPGMAQAQEEDVIDEIVVTATGRSAAIQDVPLAVQAISGETLEQAGLQSLTDLTQIAPTLRIGSGQSTTSGTIASIRGIGTGSDNPGFEGAVGIFIDGVYRARAGAALADLPDVERIEVLRGPQGTLFGKNTSAGAISVITAGPDFTTGAWGDMEFAERGGLRASFGATTGLTENLAVRIDGAIRGQDGYITDVTSNRDINSTDRWSARGQLLWDINSDASFRLIVDGGQTGENCCGAVNLQSGVVVGAIGNIYFPGALLTDDPSERNMTLSPNRSYDEAADDFGVSGELNWDIGGLTLTSVSAYRDWSAERDQDIDFTSIDRAYRDGLEIGIQTWSQEFRLQGENGPVNWLVGAFGSGEEIDTTDRIRFGADATAFANAATYFLTVGGANGARKLYDQPVALFNPTTFAPLPFTDVTLCGTVLPALHPLIPLQTATCTGLGAAKTGALLGVNLAPAPGNELNVYLPNVTPGDGQQADRWGTTTESFSLFTHNEISLGENLILTLGARYNETTKDLTASLNSVNPGCDLLRTFAIDHDANPLTPNVNLASLISAGTGGGADTPFALACNAVTNTLANDSDPLTAGNQAWADSRTENEWSGTASLAFHPTEDLMIYGGYSRGYKAGGFNMDRSGFFGRNNRRPFETFTLSTNDLEFEPEFTDAYEIGFKSTVFGGTTFNANVYYQQIHDYQSNVFSGFNFFTLNVPELISQGAEVEVSSRLSDNLTLTAGVVYNDAFYDSAATYGGDTIADGTTLAQAPEWTVSGSANYFMPLVGDFGANFYVNGRWVSEYATMTLNPNPATANEAFAIFDGRVSFGPRDGRWSVEIFGRNLTDEYYNIGGFGAPERTIANSAAGLLPPGVTPLAAGNYLVYPNTPRTVGMTLRARF